MIHLFTVHTHLTFLIAYSVIKSEGLDIKSVIFLTKDYKIPIVGLKSRALPLKKDISWIGQIWPENYVKKIDKLISDVCEGKPFIAYIDLMSEQQRILVTHKNCKGFHFIEEGNSSYHSDSDLTDVSFNLRNYPWRTEGWFNRYFIRDLFNLFRGINSRLISLPYEYMAYVNFKNIKFYVYSENAFYNAPVSKKIVVRPERNDKNILYMAMDIKLNNEIIWMDGSNTKYTNLPEEYYHKAIKKAIVKLKKLYPEKTKVYVKLRPGKSQNKNNLVKLLKESGYQIEVIPDLVLETLFMTSKNCIVIGTLTSALEYAHVFGHKAYSIYGLFEKQPDTFFDRMDGYWNNVQKL